MATCDSCGHAAVPAEAAFCPECGTAIGGVQASPAPPAKNASFSETMWFKEGGEEANEEGETGPLVDSDFQLERSKLEEKYAPKDLDRAVREEFTLNKAKD